jgi:MFS family permease
VLAGLVDRAAWLLAFEYRDLVSVGLWLAVVAAVLRVLAPMAGSQPDRRGHRGLLALGQVGGYLLVFLLCAWWVSIVQRAALGMMFGGADGVDF